MRDQVGSYCEVYQLANYSCMHEDVNWSMMLSKSIESQFYKIWLIFRETAFLFNLQLTHEIMSNPKPPPSFFLPKLWCLNVHKNWNENGANSMARYLCCLTGKNARENL